MPIGQHEEIFRSYLANAKNVPLWRAAKMTKYRQLTAEVLDLEGKLQKLSDEELREFGRKYPESITQKL
jgi:hypothetical protein